LIYSCRFESSQVKEVFTALSDALRRLTIEATGVIGLAAGSSVSVRSSISYVKDKRAKKGDDREGGGASCCVG